MGNQVGSNCGCSSTSSTNASYINVNGKKVLSQYYSHDQGKMFYAHRDSRGINGVIYKPYKPGNSPYQQKTNKADSYSRNPSSNSRTQQRQSYLQPVGKDRYGRTVYKRVYSNANSRAKTKRTQVQSLAIRSNHDKSGFENYMTLNPRHYTSSAIKTEKGSASFGVRNQSNKQIIIQRKKNRYGDYDYRAAYWAPDPANPGKQKIHTYDLGAHYKYGNKFNHSTYNFTNDRYGHIRLKSREDRKYPYPGKRESSADLTPRTDIKIGPGEQISYISPKGRGNSKVTVTHEGTKYELENTSKSSFGYVIYRKQADGSTKLFVNSDRLNKEEEFSPILIMHGLQAKKIGEVKKPEKKDMSLKTALLDLETTSPVLDTEAQRQLKQSKNALRAKVQNDTLYTDSQIERINEIIQKAQYDSDLSVEAKQQVIDEASAQVDAILTEAIKKRHDKQVEKETEADIEFLFGAGNSIEQTEAKKEAEKPAGSIVTDPNLGKAKEPNLFDSIFGGEKSKDSWLEELYSPKAPMLKQGNLFELRSPANGQDAVIEIPGLKLPPNYEAKPELHLIEPNWNDPALMDSFKNIDPKSFLR